MSVGSSLLYKICLKTKLHHRRHSWLLFILGLISILSVELVRYFGEERILSRVETAQSILLKLDVQLKEGVEQLVMLQNEDDVHEFFVEADKEQNGISYYLLEDEKLVRWSDNEPVLEDSIAVRISKSETILLPNGEFIARSVVAGNRKVVGLLLLKHEYAYENRYLKNEFNPALHLSPWLISTEVSEFSLSGPDNKILFQLKESPVEDCKPFASSSFLYLLGIIFLLGALLTGWHKLLKENPKQAVMLIITVLVIRLLMIIFKFPGELYTTDLFSPQNYASSFFFNSLGDLLLNSLLIACFATLFYMNRGLMDLKKTEKKIFLIGEIAGIVLAGYFLHNLFTGLIMNSRISFDMSRLSSLSGYTILAFACMALLMTSLILCSVAVFRKFSEKHVRFGGIILFLVLSSFYTALVVNTQNQKKEQETRKLFAQKVEARQDHVAEYLFKDIETRIVSDSVLLNWYSAKVISNERIQLYLSLNYFVGYLGKFDLNVFSFDSGGHSLEPEKIQDSLAYFIRLSEQRGKTTYSDNLFYIKDESGRLTYLAILPINTKDHAGPHTLVLWLTAKFFKSDEGFPELFIGTTSTEKNEPNEYSVATYKQGELVYEYGNYAYSFSSRELESQAAGMEYICLGKYSHLLYRTAEGNLIVVSRHEDGPLTLLTLFSWIFAFFSIFFALNYFLFRRLFGFRLKVLNLTRRIQVSVILLVVSSFVLIGTGTLVYIFKKYETDQQRSISGQVNGLWFLLGSNINFQTPLSMVPLEVRKAELNRMVRDLNLDFNLYDEQGHLYYSSQPKIFEQRIVSTRMNPEALYEIRKKGRTQYILPESAGKLKYIAAYSPFTDRGGAVTGFLNLPYFEKQNELNREISGFLSALINIYILLFAMAVLVTLFISSRITKPLLLIQEKLSGLRLGKRNEPIQYNRKDEIGQLVQEYNRMLDELTISTDKLAMSERESAWREMAKQVAHEIKNPLTPMKLSVQHLQRAWAENSTNKEELLDKMAKTIIQQIDTLSNIATEFSNFAKMPEAKIQRFDIKSVLESAVSLFSDTPRVSFTFQVPGEQLYVKADPDQLMRAFSNLLKNAVQSIPDSVQGEVKVEIERKQDDYCTIKITDNGTGIPDNQRDKIFSPNFTTKSSGMGLGLSMVKNIVQIAGGTIWFTDVYGGGTSFLIRLPLVP